MKQAWSAVVVVAVVMLGCGGEPPALVISLQIQEGADLNTSNVTGLLVRVGDEETSLPARRDQQESIELVAAPDGPTDIVVFACKGNAACRQDAAAFVGCVEADLQASDDQLVVLVPIFDVGTPADECLPFLE